MNQQNLSFNEFISYYNSLCKEVNIYFKPVSYEDKDENWFYALRDLWNEFSFIGEQESSKLISNNWCIKWSL